MRRTKGKKKARTEPVVPLKAAPGIPQLVQLYATYAAQLSAYALYASPSEASYSVAALSTNVRIR